MSLNTFDIITQLGRGAFSSVHLCERKHNKMKIVLKEIHVGVNGERMKEARNEVLVLRSLNHPNVIRYYDDFTKDASTFCILMEYATCGTLHDMLKNTKKRLPFTVVMNLFCQILMGLNHVHQKKVIHRDLKPENILLTGSSKSYVVKLGDFGISKLLAKSDDKTYTVIGTTNYLAPEVYDGCPYDRKSDIWSLGCILFELCTKEKLFDGSATQVMQEIKSGFCKQINVKRYTIDLDNIIDVTIQLNPESRPECVNILAFPVVFPYVTMLSVNLGNLK